jgi:hypothetical protein
MKSVPKEKKNIGNIYGQKMCKNYYFANRIL